MASFAMVTGTTYQVSAGGSNSTAPVDEACPTLYGVLATHAPLVQICAGAVQVVMLLQVVPQLLTTLS